MHAPLAPRGLLTWLRSLAVFLVLGCGGSSAGGEGEATEGGESSATEAVQTTPPEDSCDEASISLVGRYALTRYPGQDVVGPNGERPLGMSKEYDFGADSYTMEGYPPLRITGRYQELSRDGARLEVRFYDTLFDGQPDAERVLWLVFEDCGQTLQMDGMTYARQPAE